MRQIVTYIVIPSNYISFFTIYYLYIYAKAVILNKFGGKEIIVAKNIFNFLNSKQKSLKTAFFIVRYKKNVIRNKEFPCYKNTDAHAV